MVCLRLWGSGVGAVPVHGRHLGGGFCAAKGGALAARTGDPLRAARTGPGPHGRGSARRDTARAVRGVWPTGRGGGDEGKKTVVYLKWASHLWLSIQTFILPQRKFFFWFSGVSPGESGAAPGVSGGWVVWPGGGGGWRQICSQNGHRETNSSTICYNTISLFRCHSCAPVEFYCCTHQFSDTTRYIH